jgi:sorting nexin-29
MTDIFKRGNRKDCSNYRGISLLNTGYKIYAKIITQRLNIIAETLLHKEQNGFRRDRFCMDGFTIAQLLKKH